MNHSNNEHIKFLNDTFNNEWEYDDGGYIKHINLSVERVRKYFPELPNFMDFNPASPVTLSFILDDKMTNYLRCGFDIIQTEDDNYEINDYCYVAIYTNNIIKKIHESLIYFQNNPNVIKEFYGEC